MTNLRRPPHAHNHFKGKFAEALALLAYLARGYRPAQRPSRALAQTDLLLARGQTLVLVEVKYRPTEAHGHIAVHPHQQARLNREAIALQRLYPRHAIRSDLCLVFPHWPFVRILQNSAGQ